MTQLLNDFLSGSAAWGVLLTLAAFALGALINKLTGKAIFNPLLLGSIFVIILLSVLNISYADYKVSAAPVNYLLLPATISLAIPLYEKWDLLKENAAAIIAGISVGTLVSLGSAFALALALTRKMRGTNIFRTIFFMPNLIGGIVLGYIWQILINCLLTIIGQPLLALNSSAGYWGLIILMCWQQIGYMMIIYIAGLQNVPDDLIEAAEIDGAAKWDILWKIRVPMVMSSITICVFLTLTNSFKLFDQNLALTGGDPNHATEMLALNIYQTFYARAGMQWKGYGQAKAVIFCVLVIIISLVQLKATRSKEVQQ